MTFTQFKNWLVTSSADPTKTSLAIKGAILIGGSQIVAALSAACTVGLLCLGIDSTLLNQVASAIEQIVYAVLLLIGALITAAGLLRKLYYSRWSHPDA